MPAGRPGLFDPEDIAEHKTNKELADEAGVSVATIGRAKREVRLATDDFEDTDIPDMPDLPPSVHKVTRFDMAEAEIERLNNQIQELEDDKRELIAYKDAIDRHDNAGLRDGAVQIGNLSNSLREAEGKWRNLATMLEDERRVSKGLRRRIKDLEKENQKLRVKVDLYGPDRIGKTK